MRLDVEFLIHTDGRKKCCRSVTKKPERVKQFVVQCGTARRGGARAACSAQKVIDPSSALGRMRAAEGAVHQSRADSVRRAPEEGCRPLFPFEKIEL